MTRIEIKRANMIPAMTQMIVIKRKRKIKRIVK